jgi:hypothetical protein
MADKYQPDYRYINEIYLKEIIFVNDTNSNDVTIFGYYDNPFEEDLQRVDYWCDFSTLTDILLAANEAGEPIINAITDLLNSDTCNEPNRIDVENLFGKPLKVDNIVLTIYKPMEQDEEGEWKLEDPDEEFYIIDSVEPKEIFESKRNSKDKVSEQLSDYFLLLNNAYKYYLQLLDHDLPEKSARKKAGLKDELLFRIAVLNHQIINNGK